MTSDLKEKQVHYEQIGQYLQEIRQYPQLTPEEERELARRCADGDEEAIRKMVNSNLRLVVSIAREYVGRGVPLLDLIQEGSIGLLVAAKRFDYTLNFRFSTYATKWIRQGVSRCLSEHGIIRVPAYTAERIRKINAAKAALLQQTGEEPTVEEIASKCDMTPEKVMQLQQLEPGVCSLDTPIGDGDEDFSALLENVQAAQPYEELLRQELDQTMQAMLSALSDRQQQVLRLRYGMEDGTCRSFAQIGEMLGITKERARQVEQQAMAALQKMGSTIGLEEFLE